MTIEVSLYIGSDDGFGREVFQHVSYTTKMLSMINVGKF